MDLLVMDLPAESKRFAEIFELEQWTQAGLASDLGYKDSSVISLYLNGSRSISEPFLLKLQNAKGISAKWIRTGEGPKRLTYNTADAKISTEPHSPYNAQLRDNGGRGNMWVVPAKAQAGFIKGFTGRVFSHQIQRVSFPMIQGECFCFEVEGFSMYPDYVPNSFVVSTLIEDWSWLRKGKIYVFQTDDGIIVKAYENTVDDAVYLSSSNPTYNPVAPIKLTDLRQVYNIEFKVERPV